MCAANGELEQGDPEAPEDYLCHVAHVKAYSLGFQVPPHGECKYCERGGAYQDLLRSLAHLKSSRFPTLLDCEAKSDSLPTTLEREGRPFHISTEEEGHE